MKYRKKPVVIEAEQLTTTNCISLAQWCNGEIENAPNGMPLNFFIPTLEGKMKADFGDYIICGVQGEFYPCKPDIFEQTYEQAEE